MSYGRSRVSGRPQPKGNTGEDHYTGKDMEAGREQGYRVLSYLLAGVLVYGALGWLLDRWLDTSFLLPVGVIVGAASSIYLIIRRFGSAATDTKASTDAADPESKRKEGPTSWDNRPSA